MKRSIVVKTTCRNISMDLKKGGLSWTFWALVTFPFLGIIGIYIILVHNLKFLVDQGIDKLAAVFIFGMVGVISSIFRIFWD
jgi:hypothetical protein